MMTFKQFLLEIMVDTDQLSTDPQLRRKMLNLMRADPESTAAERAKKDLQLRTDRARARSISQERDTQARGMETRKRRMIKKMDVQSDTAGSSEATL